MATFALMSRSLIHFEIIPKSQCQFSTLVYFEIILTILKVTWYIFCTHVKVAAPANFFSLIMWRSLGNFSTYVKVTLLAHLKLYQQCQCHITTFSLINVKVTSLIHFEIILVNNAKVTWHISIYHLWELWL